MNPACLASGLALLLAGCVPLPHGAYYLPSYPDASSQVTRASCGGQAGPPVNLRFSPAPGLVLIVTTGTRPAEPTGTGRPLHIRIDLPPGAAFRFASDEVLVTPAPADVARQARGMQVTTTLRADPGSWIDFGTDGPVPADALRVPGQDAQALTELSFQPPEWAGPGARLVELLLPAIEESGGRAEFPALQLEAPPPARPNAISTYRTAEQLSAISAREAACRRETPGRRCADMAEQDTRSYLSMAGQIEASGTLFNWHEPRKPVMRSTLILQTRETRPWRIATPVIRLRDPATGTVRESVLPQGRLAWRASVPLSTPVRASTAGQAPATLITLERSLGRSDAPRVSVQLPDIVFNGKRFTMHPIELDMRRLDVGIQPFNC